MGMGFGKQDVFSRCQLRPATPRAALRSCVALGCGASRGCPGLGCRVNDALDGRGLRCLSGRPRLGVVGCRWLLT